MKSIERGNDLWRGSLEGAITSNCPDQQLRDNLLKVVRDHFSKTTSKPIEEKAPKVESSDKQRELLLEQMLEIWNKPCKTRDEEENRKRELQALGWQIHYGKSSRETYKVSILKHPNLDEWILLPIINESQSKLLSNAYLYRTQNDERIYDNQEQMLNNFTGTKWFYGAPIKKVVNCTTMKGETADMIAKNISSEDTLPQAFLKDIFDELQTENNLVVIKGLVEV